LRTNKQPDTVTAMKDIEGKVIGTILTILLTVAVAAFGYGLYHFSIIDPRNDFWGSFLSNFGVVVAMVSAWAGGMFHISLEYFVAPGPPKKKRKKK
jgi:hypothetical protein